MDEALAKWSERPEKWTNYTAYGTPQPGRSFNSSDYRYGFNGKENDAETVGTGEGTQDYGMRIYNPSLGRFLSVDPIAGLYPFYSPYQYAGNKPIKFIDIDGLEEGEREQKFGNNSLFTTENIKKSIGVPTNPSNVNFSNPKEAQKFIEENDQRSKTLAGNIRVINKLNELGEHIPVVGSMAKWAALDDKASGEQIAFATGWMLADLFTFGESGEIKVVAKNFPTIKAMEEFLQAVKGDLHHIFSNKNFKAALQWSKKFEPLFEKAGYKLDDAINKVKVVGHYGPHPQEYHEAVYKRLLDATKGLEGAEYKKAFENTLEQLNKEVSTKGTALNKLIAK